MRVHIAQTGNSLQISEKISDIRVFAGKNGLFDGKLVKTKVATEEKKIGEKKIGERKIGERKMNSFSFLPFSFLSIFLSILGFGREAIDCRLVAAFPRR